MRRPSIVALVPVLCAILVGCSSDDVPPYGLLPIDPPFERDEAAEVETLHPTLAWQSFPQPADIALDRQGRLRDARNISYELRLWQVEDVPALASLGLPVYVRTGLRQPSHRIESPLLPETIYAWAVRASFTLDGRPRLSPWGSGVMLEDPAFAKGHYSAARSNPFMSGGTNLWLYYFETPDADE